MKKLLVIFVAVLYLAVSSGLVLEIHHCMGEIADVSLLPSPEDSCGNCGMDKQENDCCKDELKLVKLQDAYKVSFTDYKLTVPEISIQNGFILENHRAPSRLTYINQHNHSPPNFPAESLCILHCVFRI